LEIAKALGNNEDQLERVKKIERKKKERIFPRNFDIVLQQLFLLNPTAVFSPKQLFAI
jgi:hypothetical protein